MPLDPYIARGVAPIDPSNALAQIAALRQRDQAIANDQQQNSLYQQKFAADQQAQVDEQTLRSKLGEMEQYAVSPQAKAAYVAQQAAQHPEFAQTPFAQLPPDQAFDGMRAKLYVALGMKPPEAEATGGPKLGNYNPGDYTPQSFGKFLQSKNPSDLQRYVTPANDKVVLVGGVPTMVDPRSHETTALSTLPNEIAGKGAIAAATAGAQTTAKAQATAAQSIPDVQTNASLMNKTLDDFEKSPGMRFLYGGYAYAPIVPGTPQADASGYLDQIVGGSFLQAYNTLRGGGQITEVEGKKATAAITRLQSRTISYGAAKQAINDLRQVIKAGVTKAKMKAGSAAPASQNDPLGIR